MTAVWLKMDMKIWIFCGEIRRSQQQRTPRPRFHLKKNHQILRDVVFTGEWLNLSKPDQSEQSLDFVKMISPMFSAGLHVVPSSYSH